ncbi:MAG: exodeoxyribonuclease III [Micavibrio sp.]|nr:exodeoxyribonuclease III [Micavibrio sp.]
MKIASWNVNSVNMRLPNVLAWLETAQPDVLLLQELKCVTENFPVAAFEAAGYSCAVHGQKSWNGVAILSKVPAADIVRGLAGDDSDEQSRYIEATVGGLRVASIYLPNGNPVDTEKYPYKLRWFDRLITRARELLATEQVVLLGGDYNIIPEARDCYDPAVWADDALFKLESRRKFRTLQNLGYTDAFRALNDADHQYTFWDYQAGAWPRNNGIRIDHLMLSPQAADRLEACVIDAGPRGLEKASDHTPIIAEIKL